MLKYVFLFLTIASVPISSLAQTSADTSVQKRRRVEFAMNITNAISRFSGNGVRNLNEDPYLMAIKLTSKNGNRAWRIGFNQFYTSQRTDIFPGTRTSTDFYFSPLLGHEWRRHLDRHFMFYFGADVRAAQRQGVIVSSDNFGIQRINELEKAIGAGPFCGFAWKINHRVMLYTEANFYVNYRTLYRKHFDGAETTVLENSARYTFTPVIPTSLFIAVNF